VEVKRKVRYTDVREGRLTFKPNDLSLSVKENIRYKIASRAAKEVKNGMSVNLGIGIPTCLPEVLPPDVNISIQSENGIIGVGRHPTMD
jgi:acyl CoA:acetate/3-ketoacid CoA transferase beta subunit